MTREELILYATPTGPLAAECERYFDAATDLGPTVAQDFPPHCTLTGFFRRTPTRAVELVAEAASVLDGLGSAPPPVVEVVALRATPEWVGLELRSSWLRAVTDGLVARDRPGPGDDPLRPKTWLHLSLAYGPEDLSSHAELARTTFSARAAAGWQVGLWQRRDDGSWVDRSGPSRPPPAEA